MICVKFKAFGVEYKIEYSFFIVVLIALLCESKQFLYLILFSSLHELGHIVTLYAFKGKAEKITLSYYGVGLIHSSRLGFIQELVFLLSGIAVNLLMVLINVQPKINLALLLINLLPIYPLDAGRCLKLLCDRIFDFYISYKAYYIVAVICLLALLFYAVYAKSLNALFICLYLFTWIIRGTYD